MKNCAFQYFNGTSTVVDTDLITMAKAKSLWSDNLPCFIDRLQRGGEPEMAIWIEMKDNTNYHKAHVHVDRDTKTDGIRIWEEKKEFINI